MKIKTLLLIFAVFCLLAPSGLAQTVETKVKSQPDAPLQIIRAECPSVPGEGIRCKVSVQIPPTGLWTAYGLKWKLTLKGGETLTSYPGGDVNLWTSSAGVSFTPGTVLERESGPFFMDIQSAEVELEFAVPAVGEVWGDTLSRSYIRMMSLRSGREMAMNYLRSIYKKEGTEGVLKALGIR